MKKERLMELAGVQLNEQTGNVTVGTVVNELQKALTSLKKMDSKAPLFFVYDEGGYSEGPRPYTTFKSHVEFDKEENIVSLTLYAEPE